MIRLGSINVTQIKIHPYTEAISYIYTALWQDKGCNSKYRDIKVNLVGKDLQEVIVPIGKDIHINVKYEDLKGVDQMTELEIQSYALEILQTGLLRIAEKDTSIDVEKLQLIKKEILERKFDFELAHKRFPKKNHDGTEAKLLVKPRHDTFEFYVELTNQQESKCKLHIYSGRPLDYYIDDFFSIGKWKEDKFILGGKRSEIEFHISMNCTVELINKSEQKDKAPLFEAMKANSDKEKTLNDYLASLDPHIAAALRNKN